MYKKVALLFIVLLFIQCTVDNPITPVNINEEVKEVIPNGWPKPFYTFQNNTINQNVFLLGKKLFYDPILSIDSTVSCGSCHQQFAAFANVDHHLSHGVKNKLGIRNAPALQNLNWNTSFSHDGGVNNIEMFPINPIENPVEMGEKLANIINKLQRSNLYKSLFATAYGLETVTSQKIFKSLTQFIGTMYSYNSKYDMVNQGLAAYSNQEKAGYTIFIQKCNSCHKEPLFSDYEFRSNGIGLNPALKDSGRYIITKLNTDILKFKTPSLRNIDRTAPYMHDGRFVTLTDCLNHYTSNITSANNTDPQLAGGINLTSDDKQNLIAFLRTLTDNTFLNDKRFTEK